MRQCKMNILGTQSVKSHTGIQCILLPARKYPPALPLFCREVCNTTNHINKCKKKKKKEIVIQSQSRYQLRSDSNKIQLVTCYLFS